MGGDHPPYASWTAGAFSIVNRRRGGSTLPAATMRAKPAIASASFVASGRTAMRLDEAFIHELREGDFI
jgi:hypothetical protein